jgi:hypothetical protein
MRIGSCHAGVADPAAAGEPAGVRRAQELHMQVGGRREQARAQRGDQRRALTRHWLAQNWANSSRVAAVSGWAAPRTRVRSAIT